MEGAREKMGWREGEGGRWTECCEMKSGAAAAAGWSGGLHAGGRAEGSSGSLCYPGVYLRGGKLIVPSW